MSSDEGENAAQPEADSNDAKTEESEIKPSPIGLSLTEGRRTLWEGNPSKYTGWLLNPLRMYIFDPFLTINSIFLPIALPQIVDGVLAKGFELSCLPILRIMYGAPLPGGDLSKAAKSSILHQPTAVSIHPPSDNYSAFMGSIAFLCSAIGDVAGMMTNPKKFKGWMDALGQFNTFLESTGVADEMHEAIQKPLLRGRLLDNFKILNDIQEVHHADRAVVAQQEQAESAAPAMKEEIKYGHRVMRFATAAYGTEMIRTALDREIDSSTMMQEPTKLIAFHTCVEEKDVQFIYANDGKEYEQHVLHHFVALDNEKKAIVLAIRGTLSLSGALVDMQGMAANFCTGKAHKGISEMAVNLWKESGDKIVALMEKYADYKLVITGHSLGAGTSCLLTVHLYVSDILKGRKIECYAFAPPPTFWPCGDDAKATKSCEGKIQAAMENTVAFINDNDVVPFLSVDAVRRMVALLDAVDNQTEHMWFWKRWKIFYEYDPIPEEISKNVLESETICKDAADVDGECPMIIPCRRVIWCKQNFAGRYEAYSCDPYKVAEGNIFLCPDMVTDHMPEQYENSLDAVLDQ